MRAFVAIAVAALSAAVLGCGGGGASGRACGSVNAKAFGADEPVNIRSEGVGCTTARRVARAITVDGADRGPAGFSCPRATTYAVEHQRCTRGSQVVTWDVEFQ